MRDVPRKPRGARLPRYDPFGPFPRAVKWHRAGKKVPGWLAHGPEFTASDQYVAWSDPVWLWYEGRDGLFLLSSSFLVVDQGYWERQWHERGGLYLYLATHCYLQIHGPQALSLTPRSELETVAEVGREDAWHTGDTIFSGITDRPDCYVAPRGLPWRAGVGSVLAVVGTGGRSQALQRLRDAAQEVFVAHRSVEAARATFLRHLWISEHQPCEAVRREVGWWNTAMQATFAAQARPVVGQLELAPLENWQLFDVDPATGAWRPR